MNLNLALSNSKLFALVVLVLLTAIILISFLVLTMAHIDVLHLFNASTAVVPKRY